MFTPRRAARRAARHRGILETSWRNATGLLCKRTLMDEVGRGDVLDGDADRLVERDLVVALAPRRGARNELAYLGHDTAVLHGVARLPERRFARFDEEPRTRHEVIVQLAPVRTHGAHGIHMRAWGQPGALHHGRLRHRGHDDAVGAADGVLG